MSKRKKLDKFPGSSSSYNGKTRSDYQDEIRTLLYNREIGLGGGLGGVSRIKRELYTGVRCVRSWNPAQTTDHTHHGAIFNFDFSTDGSILGAACERKSILLFDPHNGRLIAARDKAHTDCVNCIRFLDSRTFVTCSDDATVSLWDVRHLKHKVRTLRGHSNWVKNIEYARDQDLLVTSGFDGSIYTWDINKYTEGTVDYTRVFHTNGLMRSKLVPDSSKLIIATTSGFLMVVHDLDLSTLSHDLHGFKPNMYRLMQVSRTPLRQGYTFNHLFSGKRNRVELIADFPHGDEAEMIASLEIHPQGWCIASRNTTADDKTEWTCIHDIQESPPNPDQDDDDHHKSDRGACCSDHKDSDSDVTGSDPELDNLSRDFCPPTPRKRRRYSTTPHPINSDEASLEFRTNSLPVLNPSDGSSETYSIRLIGGNPVVVEEIRESQIDLGDRRPRRARSRSRSPPGSAPAAGANASATFRSPPPNITIFHSDEDMTSNRRGQMGFHQTSPSGSPRSPDFYSNSPSSSPGDSPGASHSHVYYDSNLSPHANDLPKIHQNKTRLTHYIEEPNVGRGFIKEIAFSSDGRLICSPFGFGVRLLAFDSNCNELCDCSPDSPRQLHEVASNMSHTKEVVTTKFSPTHCLLVTGCLNGKVDFHQPVF